MQQAINKKYNKKLPTYKKFLADRRSKSLELQSHLVVAAYMSQVDYFVTTLLGWGKLVPVFSHLDLS
jgi:hypothetical protein